jgi:hypothetical protein
LENQAAVSKIFDALKKAELASRSRPRLGATQDISAQTVFVLHETDLVDHHRPEARVNERLSRHGASHYLTWFFLGVLSIWAAAIFLRQYARGVVDNRQAIEIKSSGKVPGAPSPDLTFKQSTLALPAAISSDLPGFVLQVAAMKHKDNADSLVESLRRRNFPVFVFKRGNDSFYRVAVGVYCDADSAVRAKDALDRQGIKAILRRWRPA